MSEQAPQATCNQWKPAGTTPGAHLQPHGVLLDGAPHGRDAVQGGRHDLRPPCNPWARDADIPFQGHVSLLPLRWPLLLGGLLLLLLLLAWLACNLAGMLRVHACRALPMPLRRALPATLAGMLPLLLLLLLLRLAAGAACQPSRLLRAAWRQLRRGVRSLRAARQPGQLAPAGLQALHEQALCSLPEVGTLRVCSRPRHMVSRQCMQAWGRQWTLDPEIHIDPHQCHVWCPRLRGATAAAHAQREPPGRAVQQHALPVLTAPDLKGWE